MMVLMLVASLTGTPEPMCFPDTELETVSECCDDGIAIVAGSPKSVGIGEGHNSCCCYEHGLRSGVLHDEPDPLVPVLIRNGRTVVTFPATCEDIDAINEWMLLWVEIMQENFNEWQRQHPTPD